jgi:hypothetical protein
MTLNEKLSFELHNLTPEEFYPNSCNIKIDVKKKAETSKAEEMKRLLAKRTPTGHIKPSFGAGEGGGDKKDGGAGEGKTAGSDQDMGSVTIIDSRIVVNVLPQTEFFLLLKRIDDKKGFSMTVETDSFVRKKRR